MATGESLPHMKCRCAMCHAHMPFPGSTQLPSPMKNRTAPPKHIYIPPLPPLAEMPSRPLADISFLENNLMPEQAEVLLATGALRVLVAATSAVDELGEAAGAMQHASTAPLPRSSLSRRSLAKFSASARVRYKIRTRHSELIFSPSEAPPIPPHAMHSAFVAAVASEAAKRLHGAQGWGRGSSGARRSGHRDARSRSYPRARQGPSTSAARERRTRKPNAGRGTLPLDVLRTVRGARCANGVSARALGYRDDSRFEKRSPEKRVRARGRSSAR